MALLKCIKGSTLMETLVATVLIVVVFMITSLLLNSLFANSQKFKAGNKEAYLHELQYRYQQQQLSLPWHEETDFGEVAVFSEIENGVNTVVFEIREKESNQYKRVTLVAEP